MKKGFQRTFKKIGEILYLAVSSTDSTLDPLTMAKQYNLYQINKDKPNPKY